MRFSIWTRRDSAFPFTHLQGWLIKLVVLREKENIRVTTSNFPLILFVYNYRMKTS